ncbi:hypothetical protein C8R44DRAFT_744245 [Mycena epipterygia]|nr:hypothetical protein C8R44DRAFT_744245 [Mycena epipterygia]
MHPHAACQMRPAPLKNTFPCKREAPLSTRRPLPPHETNEPDGKKPREDSVFPTNAQPACQKPSPSSLCISPRTCSVALVQFTTPHAAARTQKRPHQDSLARRVQRGPATASRPPERHIPVEKKDALASTMRRAASTDDPHAGRPRAKEGRGRDLRETDCRYSSPGTTELRECGCADAKTRVDTPHSSVHHATSSAPMKDSIAATSSLRTDTGSVAVHRTCDGEEGQRGDCGNGGVARGRRDVGGIGWQGCGGMGGRKREGEGRTCLPMSSVCSTATHVAHIDAQAPFWQMRERTHVATLNPNVRELYLWSSGQPACGGSEKRESERRQRRGGWTRRAYN